MTALRREVHRTERHEFHLDPRAFDYKGQHYAMAVPLEVRALVTNTGKFLRADVTAHLQLRGACDRCLESVPFGLDVHYREEFLTPGQAERLGIEGDEDDDGEVRRVVYRGDVISLDDGFWQNVILALPLRCLCRPDCLGICPRCGTNFNIGRCMCMLGEVDPRLAPLQDLFGGDGHGSRSRARR